MTNSQIIENRIDHLFRHESGKMISVIARIIGYDKVDEAEDIVQDTLLKAMQTWSIKGVPDNPEAWLYSVAKNKAIDEIRKNKNKVKYESEVSCLLYTDMSLIPTIDKMFLDNEIEDSQLRMIFACCHPSMAIEYQIALVLKILAGFSSKEISRALLTNEETTNKRIYRAKKKLAEKNKELSVPIGEQAEERIHSVNRVIYLIFNEGYNATTGDRILREDLCFEALRLAELLTTNQRFRNDYTTSLLALIKCHLSRNKARFDSENNLVTLDKQDRRLWDREMMESAFIDMQKVKIRTTNKYFLEASISATHCVGPSIEKTDWAMIVSLYDSLYRLEQSPYILLNKFIAISYYKSIGEAITLMKGITELENYYLFHSTLSHLYKRDGNVEMAIKSLEKAVTLTENKQEIEHLRGKIEKLKKQ
ncbi:MAG: sigma-70 family RNA polymerase sigma factor [Candidatus Kapaibacterium sp.]|nr:sigma-70 family RNA polymerase sigma factor [Ignavibacteriota bacterium]